MSAIEELQTAVATIAERVGPSIVGIGRGTRGSGVVIADGHGPDQCPQPARRRGHRHVRRRPSHARHRRGLSTATATSRSSTSTRPARPPSSGPMAPTLIDRHARSSGPAAIARRRDARHVRPRVGGRARVPRPRRPPHRRQRRAHRAARPGIVRWGARRRRPAGSSASTPTGSARASTSPCRPTRRSATRVDALGSWRVADARRDSASRSRRRMSRAGCADRSACPSATASWSVASRTAARPRRPGSRPATSSSRPAARPIADADDLFSALATVNGPVRGQAGPRRRRADRDGRSAGRTNARRRIGPGRPRTSGG